MHQLIFAGLGTVLTILWGFAFSILADKVSGDYDSSHDRALLGLWSLGQFAILFAVVSFGGWQ